MRGALRGGTKCHVFDPERPHEGTWDTEAHAEVDRPIQDSSEGG